MFDLLDRPLVFIPVEFPGLVKGEGGEAVETVHRIELQVELLDVDEFAEWRREGERDLAEGEDVKAHNLAQFRRVVKGWRSLKAGSADPEFSDENIARLLRVPAFTPSFGIAYVQAYAGKVKTREGNSEGSPANGPAGDPSAKSETAKN